jgi:RNA polymerase sigma factor (sigma-70 family)
MDREEALERLYRERYVGFRNALTPVVGSADVARDVVQEAFARALRDGASLRRQESLAPWVWKIAWRIALRESQRSVYEPLALSTGGVDEARDPELAAAIRSLAPRRRLVLFLRYYADFSYSEIAEALAISEGTVAATLSQAHAALLHQMSEEEVRS